jgi:putative membrane protein
MTESSSGGYRGRFIAALLSTTAACMPPPVIEVPAGVARPTDAEIVSIALALHEGEVATNRAATTESRVEEVREFAHRMVADHGEAVEQIRALDITGMPHPLSEQLEESALETAAVLTQYEGSAFDREHIDSQVSLHQYALDALVSFLIPSASDERLRAALERNRMMVAAHLELALQIRASMESR